MTFKKIIGWIIIIVCSAFIFLFASVLFYILYQSYFAEEDTIMAFKDIFKMIGGFGIVIGLFILGLIYGLKRIKTEKQKIIEYTGELLIKYTGKIDYKSYKNLILGLSFKKPSIIIPVIVVILIMANFLMFSTDQGFQLDHLPILIFILVIIAVPFFTLKQIKRNFKSHSIFNEELTYEMTNRELRVKGDSLDSRQNWNQFYKAKETKEFFMLYQGAAVATLLDKRLFSANEILEFNKFLKSLDIPKN